VDHYIVDDIVSPILGVLPLNHKCVWTGHILMTLIVPIYATVILYPLWSVVQSRNIKCSKGMRMVIARYVKCWNYVDLISSL